MQLHTCTLLAYMYSVCYLHTHVVLMHTHTTRTCRHYSHMHTCLVHSAHERHASVFTVPREWHARPLHSFVNLWLDVTTCVSPHSFQIKSVSSICMSGQISVFVPLVYFFIVINLWYLLSTSPTGACCTSWYRAGCIVSTLGPTLPFAKLGVC